MHAYDGSHEDEQEFLDIAFRTVVDKKDFSDTGFIDDIIYVGSQLQPASRVGRSIQPHSTEFWGIHLLKVVEGMLLVMKGQYVFANLGEYRPDNMPPTVFISYEPAVGALNCCGEVKIVSRPDLVGLASVPVYVEFITKVGQPNNQFDRAVERVRDLLFQRSPP